VTVPLSCRILGFVHSFLVALSPREEREGGPQCFMTAAGNGV